MARGKFGGGDLGRGGNIEGDDSAHWVSPCVLMWRPPTGHSTLAEVVPLPEILPPAGYTLGDTLGEAVVAVAVAPEQATNTGAYDNSGLLFHV